MTDGIIKGTGNSWNLKSVPNFMALYPTYEAFVQALVSGTLPVDLNGMNPAGWNVQGTPLNKANLLKDATAEMYGLGADAVPNDVLAAAAAGLAERARIASGSAYNSGDAIRVYLNFRPNLILTMSANDNKNYLTILMPDDEPTAESAVVSVRVEYSNTGAGSWIGIRTNLVLMADNSVVIRSPGQIVYYLAIG